MHLKAAIFDCDGTLLDSMWMWHQVFHDVCEPQGGISAADFDHIESLTLGDGCRYLHETYGYYASAEAMYETISDYVDINYKTKCKLWPGVIEFLDTLAEKNIPMIIATSTPRVLVERSLVAHGIDHYFLGVVSTEDTGGRDKMFPDVYLEAQRRLEAHLNTALEPSDIWVFEDAPFGISTSKKVGYNVCAIYVPHDGRDKNYIDAHADLVSHMFYELTYEHIRLFCDIKNHRFKHMVPLVVNGSADLILSGEKLKALAEERFVIAVDRGVDACLAAGITPHVAIGDFDSSSSDSAAIFQADYVLKLNAYKYVSDFAAALFFATLLLDEEPDAHELAVANASGGRCDLQLTVIGQLSKLSKHYSCVAYDSLGTIAILHEGQTYTVESGLSFSVIPLEAQSSVSITGAVWELHDYSFERAFDDLGVSNKALSDAQAHIACSSGVLLVQIFSE